MSKAPKTRGRRNTSRLFCLYTTRNACSVRRLLSMTQRQNECACSAFWRASGHFLVSGYDQKAIITAKKVPRYVVCNQKARVSEVRLVLLKGFETCCTHTLCIKGLVLSTKVKISSEPLLCGLCWM